MSSFISNGALLVQSRCNVFPTQKRCLMRMLWLQTPDMLSAKRSPTSSWSGAFRTSSSTVECRRIGSSFRKMTKTDSSSPIRTIMLCAAICIPYRYVRLPASYPPIAKKQGANYRYTSWSPFRWGKLIEQSDQFFLAVLRLRKMKYSRWCNNFSQEKIDAVFLK